MYRAAPTSAEGRRWCSPTASSCWSGPAGDPAFVLVARLNADGSVDPTLQHVGTAASTSAGRTSAGRRRSRPDGKIADRRPRRTAGGTTNVAMVRLERGRDAATSSFDANGHRTLDYGGSLEPRGARHRGAARRQVRARRAAAGQQPRGDAARRRRARSTRASATTASSAIDFASGNEFGNAVALQANGKIVVAGHTTAEPRCRHRALSAEAASSTRPSAATASRGSTSAASPAATAVAMQTDGQIAIAGGTEQGITRDALVARLEGDSPATWAAARPAAGRGGPGGGPGGTTRVPRCAGQACHDRRHQPLRAAQGHAPLRRHRRASAAKTGSPAGGGNDRICAGAGNDRARRRRQATTASTARQRQGQRRRRRRQRLARAAARATTSSAAAAARTASSGGSGKDNLAGGPGRGDKCAGGAGRDRANCERGS